MGGGSTDRPACPGASRHGAFRTVVSAPAPHGEGGLGALLASTVEGARGSGPVRTFSLAGEAGDALAETVRPFSPPLVRHGTRERWRFASFDARVARRLPAGDRLVGFAGAALRTFARARALGYRELHLETCTSHVRNVARQHEKAFRAHPIEPGWLTGGALRRQLREYEAADRLLVLSGYALRSFLAEGVDARRLERREQGVAARFAPPAARPRSGDRFVVVYVGRLQVTKGVPLLLDAFARLARRDAELRLVGGWATRAMERDLARRRAADPRVRLASGDPLRHYHDADVLVHPSYEDALGLAPLEALACGVPVIVTEDTGAAERVREGESGYVVPTGSADALLERLEAILARPLRAGTSLL